MQHQSETRRLDIVLNLISAILAKYGAVEPLAADAELARHGMSSIDMVELMLAVEAEFDLAIPSAEITLANFRSAASVEALVARLGVGGVAGDAVAA